MDAIIPHERLASKHSAKLFVCTSTENDGSMMPRVLFRMFDVPLLHPTPPQRFATNNFFLPTYPPRFYRKLARREQQILFGRVDASATPELARELGLTAVPSFVTFREGEVVTSTATSNKKKIEKLVEELMYE